MNSHRKFVKLGREKNRIQYKILGLLPEIFVGGVYRKYCKTIEGYAWRFAQIPSSVVQKTLRLEKYLENKPCLKAAVAEVGVHKVAMVASIATAETDAAFADKVRNMSKPAVQEWAKELRGGIEREEGLFEGMGSREGEERAESVDGGLFEAVGEGAGGSEGMRGELSIGASKPCCAVPSTIKLELDPEMTFLFLQLKKKHGGNNKEVMMKILSEAVGREGLGGWAEAALGRLGVWVDAESSGDEVGAGSEIEEVVIGYVDDECGFLAYGSENLTSRELSPGTTFHEVQQLASEPVFIRYIRKNIRSKALKESGHQCAYPGCNRPPDLIHHPSRFRKTRNHKNIKPMCKLHHEFAHNGLIENETEVPNKWRLRIEGELNFTDQLYRKYRREALR